MPETFRIEGLEEAIRALERFPRLVEEEARPALRQGGEAIRGEVALYPPQRRLGMRMVSDRQRRFVHYAIRNGLIQVPYSRGSSPGSERLRNSWTVVVRGAGARQRSVVGARASYAALVQGPPGVQTRRHRRAGHVRIDEGLRRAAGTISRVFVEMVGRIRSRIRE